jgi:ADP-ribosylglycohydrolase
LVVAFIASALLKSSDQTPNPDLIDQSILFIGDLSPAMTERLQTLKASLTKNPEDAAKNIGIDGHTLDTVAFALYAFYKYPHDFLKILQTCIMIDKGDADSIAAIAGAFYGALHGQATLPKDLAEKLPYAEQCRELARRWLQV